MSGIAGFVSYAEDAREQQKTGEAMARALAPRGPDGSGQWFDETAMLVCRSPAVPEFGEAAQPITSPNGNYSLIYDGELYNATEIRAELAACGHVQDDASQAGLLLAALTEWGAQACLSRLNGVFAFALWDKGTRRLTLARDRLGAKPLFYRRTKDGLVFGSSLRALLCHPAVSPRLDADGLRALLLGPLRAPGDGVFQHAREVLPGHWAELTAEGFTERAYWRLEAHEHPDDEAQTIEHVRWLAEDTVQRRLIPGAPCCALLAGDTASAILALLAAREQEKRGLAPLHTWSSVCEDRGESYTNSIIDSELDESYSAALSQALDTRHHKAALDPAALVAALLPATDARDLPGMGGGDAMRLLSFTRAGRQFPAALSGVGLAALFGGGMGPAGSLESSLPFRLSLLCRERVPDAEEFVRSQMAESPPDGADTEDARRRARFLQGLRWYLPALLDREDRMGASAGLAVRIPFCDHRLVEYAYNLPDPPETLRRAFGDDLPPETAWHRDNQPQRRCSPLYTDLAAGYVRQIFRDERSLASALFDHEAVETLMFDPDSVTEPWRAPYVFASIIQLERWFKKYRVEPV